MKGYQILSTIRHKGKNLKEGIVFMPETEAAVLLAGGHIVGPLDVSTSESQDTQVDDRDTPAKAPRAATGSVKK